MAKLLNNNQSIILHSAPNSLSVLFRYEPVTKPSRLFHTDFLNSLNSQVLIDLSETAMLLHLDMVYLESRNCMRFRPLLAPECKRNFDFFFPFIVFLVFFLFL